MIPRSSGSTVRSLSKLTAPIRVFTDSNFIAIYLSFLSMHSLDTKSLAIMAKVGSMNSVPSVLSLLQFSSLPERRHMKQHPSAIPVYQAENIDLPS